MSADDPVLTAIERAHIRPRLPEQTCARLIALDAEVTSDMSTWQTIEEFKAKLVEFAVKLGGAS